MAAGAWGGGHPRGATERVGAFCAPVTAARAGRGVPAPRWGATCRAGPSRAAGARDAGASPRRAALGREAGAAAPPEGRARPPVARRAPAPAAEGALGGVRAEGQGLPLRRGPPDAAIPGPEPQQEAPQPRKPRAGGGPVSTLAPLVRPPAEVVASLWRLPEDHRPAAARPGPQPQRLWASWPHEQDGREVSAIEQPCGWVAPARLHRITW
jgi:hypothetical protein